MNGAITWEFIGWICATAAAVSPIFFGLWSRIEGARKATRQEIEALRVELHDFRVKVAEDYTSREVLKEVDSRIVASIEGVKRDISAQLDHIVRMFEAAARVPHAR